MKSNVKNAKLTSVDDLFSSFDSRSDVEQERVQEIPLSQLHAFSNHPFKVRDDDTMMDTADSIRKYGVLVPAIARPSEDGGFELVAGHRRKRASELAGLETMPVIIRDLDDDAATIIMVDSNLQWESLLPSERAFAYKMKLDAMKRQAGRPSSKNYSQVGNNFGRPSSDIMAEEIGQSKNQIFRYIRLTELIEPLLNMVDERKIALNPAYFCETTTPKTGLVPYPGRELFPCRATLLLTTGHTASGNEVITAHHLITQLFALSVSSEPKAHFLQRI